MEKSQVFFADLRTSIKENLLGKLSRLMETAGLKNVVPKRGLVAVKLHFGELGNTAFIRPLFLRQVVADIKALGAQPFLTDSNTLYAGTRGNSVSHLDTAIANGFAYSVIGAPIIIADGMRGATCAEVEIPGELIRRAYIGKEIVEADALISVAHFKGHELSGFGGTIKNLGMGCASRRGKLDQHSGLSPKVKAKKCVACGACVEHCAHGAPSIVKGKARIDPERCVGCGECILICPNGAIEVQWNADIPVFLKKMVEYTQAVLLGKRKRALFINFLTNISPACDCYGFSDAPIVQDVGIVASRDPVAIDQASVDLVNRQPVSGMACLADKAGAAQDKFRSLYPKVDWEVQLEHAERVGLGSRDYELISL